MAEGHGDQVLTLERWLHIDIEHWFNAIVADTSWLKHFMNWYYSTFHFLIPLSLLAWLYLRRPATYRWARTPLAFATMLALVGFWLYPLAPPRLMGLGYVDTAHGPQDLNNPDFGALTKLSNQYAAMPSLHVGWSLWCGVIIAIVAPYMWAKVLGILYPLLTTAVIVGTANHYVLDAVGGAAIVSAGFGLQYVLLGVGKRPREEAPPLSAAMGAAMARARGLVRQRGGGHDDAEPVDAESAGKDRSDAADEPPKGDRLALSAMTSGSSVVRGGGKADKRVKRGDPGIETGSGDPDRGGINDVPGEGSHRGGRDGRFDGHSDPRGRRAAAPLRLRPRQVPARVAGGERRCGDLRQVAGADVGHGVHRRAARGRQGHGAP
ncbi:hypothetical protein SSPO_069100 [Streptomyces antimycoticus]|uniref:Inositolphosphotransferase Aur1/Ipt1 domain-containing protein n=1 Tax=Streptomyces antimycoticus TaxID=68175 RepID=A0A499USW1_9ACTN|nr:hypothetical protein SSPO_069100 [Streptomyces antimycoticus]